MEVKKSKAIVQMTKEEIMDDVLEGLLGYDIEKLEVLDTAIPEPDKDGNITFTVKLSIKKGTYMEALSEKIDKDVDEQLDSDRLMITPVKDGTEYTVEEA